MNIKINIIRIILILLLLGTCGIIFGFSNQDSEKSSSISQKVSKIIIETFEKTMDANTKSEHIKNIEPVIRKIAHFSIYTIIGILIMSLLSTYNINMKNRIIMSIIFGFLYACSDEIHQLFINGRSGEIRDVLIDTSGVGFGTFISIEIQKIWKKMKSPKIT